jgi:hypothetical protein
MSVRIDISFSAQGYRHAFMIELVAKLFDHLYCIISGIIPDVRPPYEVVHLNTFEQRDRLTSYFVGGAVSEI